VLRAFGPSNNNASPTSDFPRMWDEKIENIRYNVQEMGLFNVEQINTNVEHSVT